jgi:hypothetical protein
MSAKKVKNQIALSRVAFTTYILQKKYPRSKAYWREKFNNGFDPNFEPNNSLTSKIE